jgi:hypothetical protein
MKVFILLIALILTQAVIEPHTELSFPEEIKQCKRTVGGKFCLF